MRLEELIGKEQDTNPEHRVDEAVWEMNGFRMILIIHDYKFTFYCEEKKNWMFFLHLPLTNLQRASVFFPAQVS